MALLDKIGYGQVELNKVSAQTTKEIIANMPAADTIEQVEMGMFLVPDYKTGTFKLPTKAGMAGYLICNEIKNYDVRMSRKDFVLTKTSGSAHVVGQPIYPRGFKMHAGDIIHTNLIDGLEAGTEAGTEFAINTKGILENVATLNAGGDLMASVVFQLEKVSTMPDGQMAAKLVCTSAVY